MTTLPTPIDPSNVPPELHSLIPYAEKWGIRDEAQRNAMLREAPLAEIEAMGEALYVVWDAVNDFTIHHRPADKPNNPELEAFDALRNAFSDVYNILSDRNPKRVLEIIGYPEAWPPMQFDPAKVPPELNALIPYAEKWVIDDEGVRDTVVQAATNVELEELLSAINQIGEARIRDLMYKMFDSETQRQEAYVFALLLEVAEQAARLLRKRRPSATK